MLPVPVAFGFGAWFTTSFSSSNFHRIIHRELSPWLSLYWHKLTPFHLHVFLSRLHVRRGVYCLGILQGILVASGFRQSLRLSTLSFSWFFPRLAQSGGKLVVNREHYRLILHFLSSRFFHPGSGLHF